MATARYHKVKIGEHELNAETLMLGYGYDPSLSEGSVKPPMFLTSTFVFQTAEQGRDFFDYLAGRRASGRRANRPRLFSLQSPEPGNRRGSACNPRKSRKRAGVCLRHGGHRHSDACLCATGQNGLI
jgi:hypothetical protein